jgi:predicted permease
VRRALVVVQVAATLVLLVGAGLLARSFFNLLSVNPGFRTDHAVVLDIALPYADDSAAAMATARFYDDLIARLQTIPGVREVGGVNVMPLSGSSAGNGTFLIMNSVTDSIDPSQFETLFRNKSRTGNAEFRAASAGYFRAMNIPLLRGRLFDDRDAPNSPHVALISKSLADKRWPNEDVIGKVIEFGNMDGDLRPFTIIGVVGDVREADLTEQPRPTFYAFYRQRPHVASTFDIIVQGANAETPSVIATARRAVHELRPDVPPRISTVEAVVSSSIANQRFTLLLIGVFGASALLLAALGVYGVIAYLVANRRQEIGVRIALGAQSGDVLRMVLREGVVLAVAGVVVGGAAAVALTRLIAGLLYGVSPLDPVSFPVVAAGLIAVALLASFLPARRAARINPLTALRGG